MHLMTPLRLLVRPMLVRRVAAACGAAAVIAAAPRLAFGSSSDAALGSPSGNGGAARLAGCHTSSKRQT